MDEPDQLSSNLTDAITEVIGAMEALEGKLDDQLETLTSIGDTKNVGVNIPRLAIGESRVKAFDLIIKILQVEYTKVLVEAKHEQAMYDDEIKSRSEDEKPKGFYFPVVRARKANGSLTLKDGFSISMEWRQFFRVGPIGSQKTMSKSLSRRKNDEKFHGHLFKNATDWEKEIIGITEDQLHELRELMKKISTAKRSIVAIRDRYAGG